MKKLTYNNFDKGILVFTEIKNAVIQIDWKKKIWSVSSELVRFPSDKKRKELLKKYKVDMTGLTTNKLRVNL